ncbi:hypothetical protein AB4305_32920, partial [Nocardia sp. 2YAB30]|uniref:hypothetical protein n=1 Tax=Nocardia sp. 2YAB30 TaxID=3233022 RepID=UPI003F9A4AF5
MRHFAFGEDESAARLEGDDAFNLDLSPGLRPGVIGLGLGFCCLTGSVRATEDGPVSGLTAGFHGSGVIRPF